MKKHWRIELKKIIWISSFLLLSYAALLLIYESDIRRTSFKELKVGKINSEEYPWSKKAGTVTSVKDYREAYDLDSNDWVAEFALIPAEAEKLATVLSPLQQNRKYRCHIAIADWKLDHQVCDSLKMRSNGFEGYIHEVSFCEAGCKQEIILWVNPVSGQSYIVGAPDHS